MATEATCISGNEGVVGEDLLMVPGFGDDDEFVIARYTISAADLVDSVPGTGSIVGSFRDLVFRATANSNSQGSVDVFVFHNGIPVFSLDRGDDNAGRLTQADGTFNVTGLSFAPGDTISFVVGNNENIGGDETALQATISIDLQSDDVLGDFDGNGVVDCDDLDFYIGNIDSAATGSLAQLRSERGWNGRQSMTPIFKLPLWFRPRMAKQEHSQAIWIVTARSTF